MSEQSFLFSLDSVRKSYWDTEVLTNAGFWVEQGRVTTLLGRNGSGKTTLIKIALGFLRTTSGVVHFRGERFVRPRLADLARKGLFYLPQEGLFDSAIPVGRHFEWLQHRFPQSRPGAIYERLRITPTMLSRLPKKLSGGELRRCEIALALARRPVCLVADEPFLGVMPSDVDVVSAALRHLASEGTGMLLSGHEVEQLFAVSDDIIWVTAGTTHHIGSPVEAVELHQFVREYLGPGRASVLLAKLTPKQAPAGPSSAPRGSPGEPLD